MDRSQILAEAGRLRGHGDPDGAFRLLQPLAKKARKDPQVQVETALAAREAGDTQSALTHLALARKAVPGDPQIANIEANTLAAAGRVDAALALFERILRSDRRNLEAHINRALVAQDAGDLRKALSLVDNSLESLPDHPRLLSIRAALLKNLDRSEEALVAIDRALAGEPQRARSLFTRGVILRDLHRLDEAEKALLQAVERGIRTPQILSTIASVKLEAGCVDEASHLYRQAFAAGDPEAGPGLVRLNREYRGLDDAFDHYRQRAQSAANVPQAWDEWLAQLSSYGEYEAMAEVADAALGRFPEHPGFRYYAAVARYWSGNRLGGFDALKELTARQPDSLEFRLATAEAALAMGDGHAAETYATAATRIDPLSQSGWCYLATAWRLQEDEREFWLCDYDRFIMQTWVVPDEGDMASSGRSAAYARDVAETLEALHATSREPGNQSLRSGTQTSGSLFKRSDPALRRFRDAAMDAVAKAVSTLPDDDAHPFLSRNSRNLTFSGSWSVRLARGSGHHVAHFHSQGWLSSAYYARLPDLPDEGGANEGYIQFGAPPKRWGLELGPRRVVKPEAGKLVLFPSYMWHGTLPFRSAGTRLTAAFDIMPTA